MLKIRRPLGRLIFNMGIAIPGKTVFLIETAPWLVTPILGLHVYPTLCGSLPGYSLCCERWAVCGWGRVPGWQWGESASLWRAPRHPGPSLLWTTYDTQWGLREWYIHCLVLDCGISSALAKEIPQSCAKQLILNMTVYAIIAQVLIHWNQYHLMGGIMKYLKISSSTKCLSDG